jgi:hypothetical protein
VALRPRLAAGLPLSGGASRYVSTGRTSTRNRTRFSARPSFSYVCPAPAAGGLFLLDGLRLLYVALVRGRRPGRLAEYGVEHVGAVSHGQAGVVANDIAACDCRGTLVIFGVLHVCPP